MGVSWFSRPLTVGLSGADVRLVQRKLRAGATGLFTSETAARVRGLQHEVGLPVTGVVDFYTAQRIGESVRLGMLPDWYVHDLGLGMAGDDVDRLRELLGVQGGGRFDRVLEAAVRRFQSAHRLPLSGVVREMDAVMLGDDVPWREA